MGSENNQNDGQSVYDHFLTDTITDGLGIVSGVGELSDPATQMISEGSEMIDAGNRNFWSDSYGSIGKIGELEIVTGANTRNIGNGIDAIAKTGKWLGTAGDIMQAGVFGYQMATGDYKGASGTAGDYVGGALGSMGTGFVVGGICMATGVGAIPGAIIIATSATIAGYFGGTAGEAAGEAIYEKITE